MMADGSGQNGAATGSGGQAGRRVEWDVGYEMWDEECGNMAPKMRH